MVGTDFSQLPWFWQRDEHGCLNLRFIADIVEPSTGALKPYEIHAWIIQRPYYCDRGHWLFNVSIPGVDWADGFPRYYMDLDIAKREAEAWLRWRLFKQRS